MGHDTTLGLPDPLDRAPQGVETLLDTLFVATAAVVGITAATLLAAALAPLGAGVALVALFVGWPLGFVGAGIVLRAGVRALVDSGVLVDLRRALWRVRAGIRRIRTGASPVVTDGAGTGDCDTANECH
ncbi:hypothetical protein [Haloferax larsenii]|uniref:Uncharacterized protein n=1 Tax=Haloferax larsenii TaxID=302484 RepID=A0A1H7R3U7_HALLR|nr:hypothetical protein [Haloferax larsenii]SEL54247.1 hypothetical protein SAMN04488691_105241 [Haloferax larsenii]